MSKRNSTILCQAWSQDWGRDTHICVRTTHDFDGDHRCKCGAVWAGPNMRHPEKKNRLKKLFT